MENVSERPGYHFAGWYIDKECTKRINPGGKLPHAVTLYDKWVPILYPVTYEMHGGINSRKNPQFVTVESGVCKLYPAQKPGMRFAGWVLNGQKIDVLPDSIDHPVTLHAMFKPAFVISFDSGGGGQIEAKETNEDGLLESFDPPKRIGCDFAGWFWDPERKWRYDFDQPFKEDCTLYAGWYYSKFPITYDLDGGLASRTNPRFYMYSEHPTQLLPARKKGHRFLGWFDSNGNKVEYIPPYSLGERSLQARYKKIKSHARKDTTQSE